MQKKKYHWTLSIHKCKLVISMPYSYICHLSPTLLKLLMFLTLHFNNTLHSGVTSHPRYSTKCGPVWNYFKINPLQNDNTEQNQMCHLQYFTNIFISSWFLLLFVKKNYVTIKSRRDTSNKIKPFVSPVLCSVCNVTLFPEPFLPLEFCFFL